MNADLDALLDTALELGLPDHVIIHYRPPRNERAVSAQSLPNERAVGAQSVVDGESGR